MIEATKQDMEFGLINAARDCGVIPDSVAFNAYVSMDDNVVTYDDTTVHEIVHIVNEMMKGLSDSNNHYFTDTEEDVN